MVLKVIYSNEKESIAQMLKFPNHVTQEPLDDNSLALKY
jgi:hypothetical protein